MRQSEPVKNLADRVELAAAAIDDDEVGPLRKRIVVRFGFGGIAFRRRRQQPLEAPLQHLAHHRVIVARRQAFGLDVELAILVLDEAVRPRHDHGTHRVSALDVAVVVDLDPPR